MSQPVSTAFDDAAAASVNDVTFGFLVAWDKEYDAGATFFEIGTSSIEGPDFLKGAGDDVTFFDKYNFEDESAHVNDLHVSRMSNVKPYGVFSAEANVELDNISKRYMPGFDPDIGLFVNKNRRPIKISAGFDGENVQQFVGFSDRPRGSLMAQKTTMHAYDVMEYFSTAETTLHTFEGYFFHEIIEEILLDLGFGVDQFVLEESLQLAAGFVITSGMTVRQIFQKICEAEQGVIFADELGIIHFWNRQHFAGRAYDPPQAVYDYTNVRDIEWSDTPITNWIRVIAKPRAVAAFQPVWTNAEPIEIEPGGSVTVVARFEDEDGDLPVTAVMDPVYITARDDLNRSFYETNYLQDGTGATGSAFVSLTSVSLAGNVAFLVFANSDSAAIYLTNLEIHGTPAKVVDRITQEYKDEDSIEKYGINPESNNGEPIEIENDWIQDAATALSLAREQVNQYADPEQQLHGAIFGNPAHQYGDVVTLRVNDIEVDPRYAIVVGTELKMSMGNILDQKVIFEYRDDILYQSYFTIELSEIGGTHAIAA